MTSAGTAFLQAPFVHYVRADVAADGARGEERASVWSLSGESESESSHAGSAYRTTDAPALARLGEDGRGPVLIAIDGPRASGKTTLAHRLARTLATEHGLDVVVEAGVAPDDDARRPSSPRLRALAEAGADARKAQQCLAALNRVELLDALRVQLQREGPRGAPDLILLDGYTFSGMVDAYRHDCVRAVRRVQEAFCVAPALTLLLRVSPLILAGRRPLPGPAVTELIYDARLHDAVARASTTRDVGSVGFVQPLNGMHSAARVCEMARRIVVLMLQEDGALPLRRYVAPES